MKLDVFSGISNATDLIKSVSTSLRQKSIKLALLIFLQTLVSITNFFLMALPLKLVIIIISARIEWVIFNLIVSKTSLILTVLLAYLITLILNLSVQNLISIIKKKQTIIYEGLASVSDASFEAKPLTLNLFGNLVRFYSSFYLTLAFTLVCVFISWPTILVLCVLALTYAFILNLRITNQSIEKNKVGFFFRITTIVTFLIYILVYFNNSESIIGLLLLLSARQWSMHLTQIGDIIQQFHKRIDLPLSVYSNLLESKKDDPQGNFELPEYFCPRTQLGLFSKIYSKIEIKKETNLIATKFIETHLSSINCFSTILSNKDEKKENDLMFFYTNSDLAQRESLILNSLKGNKYCPSYHKIPDVTLKGFLLKGLQTKGLSKQKEFIEILPDFLYELWRFDPGQQINEISSGYQFMRHLRKPMFDLLKSISSSSSDVTKISKLEGSYELIIQKLLKIPVTYFHPHLSKELFFLDQTNAPKLFPWGYTTLEPAGSQLFQIKDMSELEINSLLVRLGQQRADFKNIKSTDLIIASLCYEIIHNYKRKSYSKAQRACVKLADIL